MRISDWSSDVCSSDLVRHQECRAQGRAHVRRTSGILLIRARRGEKRGTVPRLAYVNGAYVPHRDACVHIEDRGYQFADGVYEVVYLYRGRLVDEGPHLDRLDRSLRALRIGWPVSPAALKLIMRELVRRNRASTGLLYVPVTRGVA